MSERVSKKVIESFVLQEIEHQVKFCQQQFDLPDTWRPYVKLNFSGKHKASQAGRNVLQKPFMVLELGDYLEPVTGFIEYSEYAENLHIGAFKSRDWRTCARALISHELAHCVQFTLPISDSTLRDSTNAEVAFHGLGVYSLGHGKFFQKIYGVLRKKFVNDHVAQYCMGIQPPPTGSLLQN